MRKVQKWSALKIKKNYFEQTKQNKAKKEMLSVKMIWSIMFD